MDIILVLIREKKEDSSKQKSRWAHTSDKFSSSFPKGEENAKELQILLE